MTENVLKWMLFGVAMSLALTVLAPLAQASHYRLESLDFIGAEKVAAFQAAGIQTTEDLLVRTLNREGRQRLSEETGISEIEILDLARMCEFLQIEGVGPRVVQLLRATGVVNLSDLITRNPEELAQQLSAVNAVEQITGIDPDAENLTAWISAVESVPYRVE